MLGCEVSEGGEAEDDEKVLGRNCEDELKHMNSAVSFYSGQNLEVYLTLVCPTTRKL